MKKLIEYYISELLYIHDCVIIPKFGGFIGNNISSKINEFNSTISPPNKEILFNKNLNNNDGLLTNHISINENITNEEVREEIANFVENIQVQLKTIKTFRLNKIGIFSINTNNKIQFAPDRLINYNINSFGLEQQKINKISVINSNINDNIIKISHNPRHLWRAAAILIPIIGISLITITQQEKIDSIYSQMSKINPLEILNINNNIRNNDLIKPVNNDIKINIQKTKKIKKSIITTDKLKENHFIIAGSFSNPENANRLLKELQKDFPKSSIIGKNKDGLIRVSYGGFYSKENAIETLNNIKSENKSGWILSL